MGSGNELHPSSHDETSTIHAQVAALRGAFARIEEVPLPSFPEPFSDRKEEVSGQLRKVLLQPGSGFAAKKLHRLADRVSLEAALVGQPDELEALIDQIRAHLETDIEIAPPHQLDWAEALALARLSRRLVDHAGRNSRRQNISAALTRLTAGGHIFGLDDVGLDSGSSGFQTVTEEIVKVLSRLGRVETFRQLEGAARRVHGYEFDQITFGRNSSNTPREPSFPFGFLWQLAARLPDMPIASASPANDWHTALQLARDLVALTNVETYGQFWMIGATVDVLSQILANAALHDHLFSVQQWSAYLTPLLLRSFFGTSRDEKLRENLGWGIEDAAAAAEVLLQVTQASPSIITPQHLERRLPKETVDALLRDLAHTPPAPNADYKSPFDARRADLMFKPLLAGRVSATYLVPSTSTAGPAFYEAVAMALRGKLTSDEMNALTGTGLETAVGALLRFRHLEPSVQSKNYGPAEDRGECDLVVEDDQTILFLECKAKALTRAAMAGDPQDALFAYLQGVVASQAQALHHETVLRRNGQITFDDGSILEHRGREIVRVSVTLFDHGTLQDRFLFANLSGVLAAIELSASSELADKGLRKRIKKTNETLQSLRHHLTEDLGGPASHPDRIWQRALPTASVSFAHLAIILIEHATASKLANVLRKPATFMTGSVLKEYALLRQQNLLGSEAPQSNGLSSSS
ncbi:hypothetical protein [Methylobacterium brachiatum]|uniref:hypothetical protein n=1 Tax=Methylobacterium brachiatum TaxID=269660 RepID=UPI003314BA29